MVIKMFRVFAFLFIGLTTINLIFIKTAFLSIELVVDTIFSLIVFAIFYNSIKLISRYDYSSRIQSIMWLGIFAIYQFLHLFHINDCNLYACTNNLVNLAFIIAMRNTWQHHYELIDDKHLYLRWAIKVVNIICGIVLLLSLPIMLSMEGIGTHSLTWLYDLLMYIVIPFVFINLAIAGYLMRAHLHTKKIIAVFAFQIIGTLSYLLAHILSIEYAVGNVFLIISYIAFFDLYFINELKVKVRYERNEKDHFFNLFLDNPDIFLILQENKNTQHFFIANANRAAENKFGKALEQFTEVPELLFGMTLSDFAEWIVSKEEFLFNIELNISEKPFVVDISKKKIKIGDSIWILINIRSVEERVESSKKINIFEEVFKNAVEAMLVADKNKKIIWVNDEYVKLYGYPREELIGNSPNIVKSGKQNHIFYQVMWHEINTNNKWQGEFYNKKKNGELIKVRQSIVRINAGPFLDDYYISHASDLTEKTEYENQLFQLAYVSRETGLFNRAYLENIVSNVVYETAVMVYLNDINYVKTALGERIGNIYIREIINRLKVHCDRDIYEYNSEVLLFFCQDELSDHNNHIQLINNLYQSLKYKIEYEEELGLPDISLISSMGEAKTVSNHLVDMQKTLEYVKLNRQKGVIVLDEALKKIIEHKFMFYQELKHALTNSEFYLDYQPIIDIWERKIIGAEALIRWKSKTMGSVQPKAFIELLEDSELIHEVGYFVLERALSDCAILLTNEDNRLLLSVNISPVQLTHNNFIQNVSTLIEKYKVPHEHIIFEVIESQKFDKISMVRDNLKGLRSMGINIAIDDFGTEYSSLTRLSDLDVQFIKIDKAFFDNIHNSLSHALLVSGVIALAKRMNISIISEGIENYNQLLYLVGQECRLVQGYFFEKPMTIEHLIKSIDKRYEPILSLEDQQKINQEMAYEERAQVDNYKSMRLELGLIEIDSNGEILNINKTMNQWSGGMSDIMIGTQITEWLIFENQNKLNFVVAKNSRKRFVYEELLEEVISLKLADGSQIKLLMTTRFSNTNRTGSQTQLLYFENISQLDSAMKHIVEKRASYKRVFQFSPLPILIWNLNYHIMDWNLEAEKLFNLKLHESSLSIGQLFDKEGLELLRNYTDKVMLSKETVMESSVYDGLGNIHLSRWYSQPIYDDHNNITKIISIIDDITDRKKAESEIKRLYHVLDQSEQMYLLMDTTGTVLYANHQMKALLNDEFCNFNDLNIEFINDDNTVKLNFDEQDDVWSGTCRIYTEKIISLNCYREVISESKLDSPKILFSLRDETETVAHQREMNEIKKKFAEQDRLAAIGQLSAGIAHEINNPLSYMLTNTNYLMKLKNSKNIEVEAVNNEIFEIVESYQEGLMHIKNIVGDLKSFVHSGSDEFQIMQINELIPKVINVAYNEIKYSSVVKLELFEELIPVPINKSKIQQVLLNLILNANHAIASKYTKSMGEIKVRTQNAENGVLIEISDNGCGMGSQTMSRIFEPFYTTKAEGIGSGLGLSISKEIIENLHNGQLTVSSEEEIGTVFTIYLPNESTN